MTFQPKDTVEDSTVIHVWDYEQDIKERLRSQGLYDALVEEAQMEEEAPVDLGETYYTATWTSSGSDEQSSKQPLSFVATPCNLGGVRLWFRCYCSTDIATMHYGCRKRVGALYKPPGGTVFLCRDCWDLTYEQRQRKGSFLYENIKQPRVKEEEALERVRQTPSCENWRELYEARQARRKGLCALADRLNVMMAFPPLPPFEEWLDKKHQNLVAQVRDRPYGWHGRCTAMAKTTGERCRQPATGDHNKCYYHGGVSGVGSPSRNQNAVNKQEDTGGSSHQKLPQAL